MDKSRQQFEAWFNDEYKTTMKDYDEPLIEFVMKQLFIVWQASRESAEPEIKHQQLRELVNTARDTAIKYQGCQCLRSALSTAIRHCLTSNGVKIKDE
ncbi:hypothetical protein ACX956_003836 [Proteus mirabilis]|uniref:hypothetical protein n=1 Tax=Proteus mirabilis TaxID=584 RepID=UPI0005384D05|nr:hypothetical protein [Proteus mirabilis]AUU38569.1 hypothetical protein MC73_006180 [Proteus mirabilis]